MIDDAAPAREPTLRADSSRSKDCTECRGWGTVVTDDGCHQLCPVCQPAVQHTLTGGATALGGAE